MKKHILNSRIPEIDLLRGTAVLFMIFDHLLYDIAFLLPSLFPSFPAGGSVWADIVEAAKKYWFWDVRTTVRFIILAIFLLLTGICCSFSKSNLRRGIRLIAASLSLTAVSGILSKVTANPDILITFGVLHCAALSLMLIGILEIVTTSKWFWLIIGAALTCVGAILYPHIVSIPYEDSGIPAALAGQILGVAAAGGDSFSFPLFGGQIFIGVFLGRQLYPNRKSLLRTPYRNNLLTWIGRHSLVVYFAHQIILPLLLGAIILLCGY